MMCGTPPERMKSRPMRPRRPKRRVIAEAAFAGTAVPPAGAGERVGAAGAAQERKDVGRIPDGLAGVRPVPQTGAAVLQAAEQVGTVLGAAGIGQRLPFEVEGGAGERLDAARAIEVARQAQDADWMAGRQRQEIGVAEVVQRQESVGEPPRRVRTANGRRRQRADADAEQEEARRGTVAARRAYQLPSSSRPRRRAACRSMTGGDSALRRSLRSDDSILNLSSPTTIAPRTKRPDAISAP